jgi:hypothetical protein
MIKRYEENEDDISNIYFPVFSFEWNYCGDHKRAGCEAKMGNEEENKI